jgi:hypothetical protein
MKFTVKGLIALCVTSSVLFLTPMRSDAQVNMKSLAEVVDSCQKDVPSKKYYQQMLLNVDKWYSYNIEICIYTRYHYSLVLSQFSWLSSAGEILPGYPGSVVVGNLANTRPQFLLNCLISLDPSSSQCNETRMKIAKAEKYRNLVFDLMYGGNYELSYPIYVCPSCVVAHDELSGSREAILKAFIEWFITLDKPQRREVISVLGDEDKARTLRDSLKNESEKAVQEYQETRARVQQQEQERRRRELLGN